MCVAGGHARVRGVEASGGYTAASRFEPSHLLAAGTPAVLMPVPAFVNSPRAPHSVALLPHHQMRGSGGNRPVAFRAGVGFEGIHRGYILHEPVAVAVTFETGCRIKNSTDITSRGCATVPLAAGGTGCSLTGMILSCHEPYSTAPPRSVPLNGGAVSRAPGGIHTGTVPPQMAPALASPVAPPC